MDSALTKMSFLSQKLLIRLASVIAEPEAVNLRRKTVTTVEKPILLPTTSQETNESQGKEKKESGDL